MIAKKHYCKSSACTNKAWFHSFHSVRSTKKSSALYVHENGVLTVIVVMTENGVPVEVLMRGRIRC